MGDFIIRQTLLRGVDRSRAIDERTSEIKYLRQNLVDTLPWTTFKDIGLDHGVELAG